MRVSCLVARLTRPAGWIRFGRGPCLSLVCLVLAAIVPVGAQPPASSVPDYSKNPQWFPTIIKPYQAQSTPDVVLSDVLDLQALATGGRLPLSLEQLRAAVRSNNLDVAAALYNLPMAETDILRARGGGAPRGTAGVRIPGGLFAGAIGAGVGDTTTVGGSGGAGGITGNARQVTARPRGTYDPSLALNFSYDRTTSPLNTLVVAGVPAVRTSTTALQARFAQAFTTGTSVSVSFNNQRQVSTQEFLRFNPSDVSSFSLVVTQQLLNGFGRNVNRRFLTVAEAGERIARESIRLQVSTSLAETEAMYWDLVAARENVRVAERALAVSEQFLQDNREREAIGTVSGIEVLTAASEASARRRDLIAAQTVYDRREADLKNALTRDVSKILSSVRLEPVDPLPDPSRESVPSLEDALAQATRYRAELRQAALNLQIQDVAIGYTRNLLKPTLVVFGMLNSSGLYGNRLIDTATPPVKAPGGLGGAIRQVGCFEYPEYAFGFSLQFPLLNRSAQADHARARIEKRQAETALDQLRLQVRLEIRNALVALTQSKARVESAAKAVEYAARSVDDEQERLLAGQATPYDVIRRQRDLMTAQFGEVQARADYAKARVDLERAIGPGRD
jgi:outer membrane protein TolC